MSITQTYYLAHKARAKLSREAGRGDHNLRLLVGHANLLDSLMIELADAEREQENWFNESVRDAEPQQHINDVDDWAVESESDSDSESSDSDLDDMSDDEEGEDDIYQGEGEEETEDDVEMVEVVSIRRVPQTYHQLTRVPSRQSRRTPLPPLLDSMVQDDDEDCADLGLAKLPSYSTPPELDHDVDTSEDEAMPPSPQQDALAFPATTTKDADDDVVVPDVDGHDLADGAPRATHPAYYVPPENPSRVLPAYPRVF